MKLLHAPDPVGPLPPYGTKVVVKKRQWGRKTPHDPKVMVGKAFCPAANAPNASVILWENNQFYVARIYQGVLEPSKFKGHVADDIPPAPPRRVRGETSMARRESGDNDLPDVLLGDDVAGDADSGGSVVLGSAGSGGDAGGEEGDEFEGMVPDSVSFERLSDSGVCVRNLWSETVSCKMRDTPRTAAEGDTCRRCGTWQGECLMRKKARMRPPRSLKPNPM